MGLFSILLLYFSHTSTTKLRKSLSRLLFFRIISLIWFALPFFDKISINCLSNLKKWHNSIAELSWLCSNKTFILSWIILDEIFSSIKLLLKFEIYSIIESDKSLILLFLKRRVNNLEKSLAAISIEFLEIASLIFLFSLSAFDSTEKYFLIILIAISFLNFDKITALIYKTKKPL